MYFTTAKFKSRCTQTGKFIDKSEVILYDKENKKVYCSTSERYQQEKENRNTADVVDAQENSFFDNFSQNYL